MHVPRGGKTLGINSKGETMNKKGFSLLELLTVITIVGILSSVALPQYRKVMEKARFTKAQAMAKSLHDSCERMMAEFDTNVWDDLVYKKNRNISNLDVVGSDVLPLGYSVDGTNSVKGKGYKFTLIGACNVDVEKYEGSYKVKFTYTGTDYVTCTNVDDDDGCEIYGLVD